MPRLVLAALAAALGGAVLTGVPTAALAQDTTAVRDSLTRQLERLQRQIDSLKETAERQNQRLMEMDERTGGAPGAPAAPNVAAVDSTRPKPLSSRGIYGKPFVRKFGGGTAVGGYVDAVYSNDIDGHTSAFDQQRFVPFIFSEITDKLHFGSEIEFEHAPSIEVEDGEAEGAGEVKVEFATLDYQIREALNVRAGLLLAPLGRFNLVHDSPVNDLTDRPLVDRFIIPTTLSQTGFGLFGTVYPSARSLLTYELYLVNGFTSSIVGDEGVAVREGTGFSEADNNFAKSIVGRVAVSPFLGVEVGVSGHTGKYASRDAETGFTGDERLTIGALDATVQRGPFELLGEYARLAIDLPDALTALRFDDRQEGFYLQGNYHFGQGWVAPRATSVFTGVVRWDRVDMAASQTGNSLERLSVGLNWRPVEDAVLKTDFQWNWRALAGESGRGAQDRQLRVSMATYF
jgi:hypothetical protein